MFPFFSPLFVLAQETITNGGALSADYTLHVAFGVIGILLLGIFTMVGKHFINVLDKMELRLDACMSAISENTNDITELRTETDGHKARLNKLDSESTGAYNNMTKLMGEMLAKMKKG